MAQFDLRTGRIACFYFGNNREETIPAIDNLMLHRDGVGLWMIFCGPPALSFPPEFNGHT